MINEWRNGSLTFDQVDSAPISNEQFCFYIFQSVVSKICWCSCCNVFVKKNASMLTPKWTRNNRFHFHVLHPLAVPTRCQDATPACPQWWIFSKYLKTKCQIWQGQQEYDCHSNLWLHSIWAACTHVLSFVNHQSVPSLQGLIPKGHPWYPANSSLSFQQREYVSLQVISGCKRETPLDSNFMRHQKLNAENRAPCWMFALWDPALWITRHCSETTAPYPCPRTPMEARVSFLANETTRIANMNQYTPQVVFHWCRKKNKFYLHMRVFNYLKIFVNIVYPKKNRSKKITASIFRQTCMSRSAHLKWLQWILEP